MLVVFEFHLCARSAVCRPAFFFDFSGCSGFASPTCGKARPSSWMGVSESVNDSSDVEIGVGESGNVSSFSSRMLSFTDVSEDPSAIEVGVGNSVDGSGLSSDIGSSCSFARTEDFSGVESGVGSPMLASELDTDSST